MSRNILEKYLQLINMEHTNKIYMLKTITWRITASLDTFVIAWVVLPENCKMGGSIAGIEVIIQNMIIYYFHERIWN